MSSLLITLSCAFAVVIIAVVLLGISWLITGKSKLRPGACGRDPTKNKEKDCGLDANCQLCKKDDKQK